MPPDVPAETVAFWEGALQKVAESRQWKREYLDRFRDEPRFVGSKEFGQVLETTNGLYAKLMTELGLIKIRRRAASGLQVGRFDTVAPARHRNDDDRQSTACSPGASRRSAMLHRLERPRLRVHARHDAGARDSFRSGSGSAIVGLSIANLIRSLRGAEILESQFDAVGLYKALAIVGFVTCFILMTPWLGMLVASGLLIPALAFAIRPRWTPTVAATIVAVAAGFPDPLLLTCSPCTCRFRS